MVVSVSRRTDIPAFFFDWFLEKLDLGVVEVPHPFNPNQKKAIPLTHEAVDAFVFWTKDPSRLLPPHPLLDSFPWVVLITLTPYRRDWENSFPDKEFLIQQFQRLSDRIGKERVVWRYDPIILTQEIRVDWHKRQFEKIARSLSGYTDRCIVSFVSLYRKNKAFLNRIGWIDPTPTERITLLQCLRELAENEFIQLVTCADPVSPWPGACIDGDLLSRVAGRGLELEKDPNQRPACLCRKSVDIGTYGTCKGGCLYCYAK
ncbi:MAG: DUF1848 domain-containing protein [Spirochaetes bacterium]|nr:DUF1848 domain-containing protein [Spirochaetota bacterium]